jgi:signal transduction histidine kinase
MVSDISHDIRTPLTSIIGYMEALKNDNNLNNEEKKEYTNIVISKCHTLNNLVQSFFEFSRLDEDGVSISLEKVDINSKIRSVKATFYHDFENEGIIPDIILPEIPIYVSANNMALDRVLQNLISNVMLYGKEGGFFGVSVEENSNRVSVNIWDKGNGITADEMNHLFERSYTIKSANTGKSVISGLGLSIVKRLIEKQNGEITVSSIPGEKTMFTFSLQKHQ